MEMRTLRESIPVERVVGQRQAQAVVEGEITLPGGLREEARVLQAGGMAVINGLESLQDRVNVDGKVIFHVLYTQGDPAKVQVIEASADFSHTLDIAGAAPKMLCRGKAWVEHVDANAYNGRLNLKAIVMLGARVLSGAPVEAVTGISQCSGLQMRSQTLSLARTVAQGSAEALLREEFELPQALEITDTLYASAQASVGEVIGGQGRASVSGTVSLEVYHASDMPAHPLTVTRHAIPFEQSVELGGGEAQMLRGDVQVKDVAVLSQDAGDGSRVLRAEVVLGIEAWGDVQEEWTILKDAYTTQGEGVSLASAPIACRIGDSRGQTAESGKMLLMLPEGSPAARTVLCGFATPILTGREQVGGRLNVEGMLEVTLLYMTDDSDAPVTISQEEPFRMTFAASPQSDDFLQLEASDIDVSAITSDRVEMKYILRLTMDGVDCRQHHWISDVAPQPAREPMKGAALYFVQPGEGVWEIARRYRIPQEELVSLNEELSKREPQAGEAVVVFRRMAEQ